MMYDLGTIKERIKKARSDINMTQEQLAKRMGYERETVTAWESGKNTPKLDALVRLCDILQCDLGFLLGEYKEKRREVADACAVTGLSESAVKRLYQLHHAPHTASHQELGVSAKGYTVSNVGVLSKLIESDGYLELINQTSFYLIYGGVLPQDAYTSDEKELSLQEYERFYKWANGSGREVVMRKDICEMHLQRASDELKNIFRDILKKEVEKRAQEK